MRGVCWIVLGFEGGEGGVWVEAWFCNCMGDAMLVKGGLTLITICAEALLYLIYVFCDGHDIYFKMRYYDA